METIAQVPQRQTLSAVVYPVCVCGLSYPDHADEITMLRATRYQWKCSKYVPVRPIQDLGIISDKVIN